MNEILKYLDVMHDSIATGDIIEECSQFYPDLEHFVVSINEYQAPLLEDFILKTMNVNKKHFAHTFETDKKQAMAFVLMNCQFSSFTDEIVKDCGGVQQFLDRYAGERNDVESEANCENLDGGVADADLDEGVAVDADYANECNQTPQENARESDSYDEMQRLNEMCEELETTRERDLAAVTAMREEAEKLEAMAQKKLDNVVEKEEMLRDRLEAITNLFDENGNLIAFEDGKIVCETAKRVSDLTDKILLGDLDPACLLNPDDVSQSLECVKKISPRVVMQFVQWEISKAAAGCSDYDKIKGSVIANDLAEFLLKQMGGDACE